MAGLKAASDLQRAGAEVTLLEARDRRGRGETTWCLCVRVCGWSAGGVGWGWAAVTPPAELGGRQAGRLDGEAGRGGAGCLLVADNASTEPRHPGGLARAHALR